MILRRYDWDGVPIALDDLFAVRKGRRSVVCRLVTHPLGWELRLDLEGDLIRSQVCKIDRDVFDGADDWKRQLPRCRLVRREPVRSP